MEPLLDLRAYVAALEALGEVQEISREVELDLEVGAVIRRCYETGSPAPLFTRLHGAAPGFRILGAPAGISRKPGHRLARVALSLDMEPYSTAQDILNRLTSAHGQRPVPATVVEDAPCFENVFLGDDIDITTLPAPLLHQGDGGRYLNTYGCIVAQTPDRSWTNWSIARIQVLDSKRMTGSFPLFQHISMVRRAWKKIGKPMPFALALGVEPSVPFVCAMPLPAHVSESGYLGAMLGRSIRTVPCRTVDLEAPASAEILVEGYVGLDDTAMEGPVGEYGGYIWPEERRQQPVYHVTGLSHRNNAILPVVVAGEPIEEDHTVWGLASAAQCLAELRDAAVPVTTAWVPFESAVHWLVVTVPSDWRERSGRESAQEFCHHIGEVLFRTKAGAPIPKIIVVHDDVDPTDTSELVWAFATRCHPTLGHSVFGQQPVMAANSGARSAWHRRRQPVRESKNTMGSRIVYNCLQLDEWGGKLPARSSFDHCYPPEIVARVLDNWTEYGFGEV
jgi:4-hydroxy-3-polyprenylbenzoate decarboxylase